MDNTYVDLITYTSKEFCEEYNLEKDEFNNIKKQLQKYNIIRKEDFIDKGNKIRIPFMAAPILNLLIDIYNNKKNLFLDGRNSNISLNNIVEYNNYIIKKIEELPLDIKYRIKKEDSYYFNKSLGDKYNVILELFYIFLQDLIFNNSVSLDKDLKVINELDDWIFNLINHKESENNIDKDSVIILNRNEDGKYNYNSNNKYSIDALLKRCWIENNIYNNLIKIDNSQIDIAKLKNSNSLHKREILLNNLALLYPNKFKDTTQTNKEYNILIYKIKSKEKKDCNNYIKLKVNYTMDYYKIYAYYYIICEELGLSDSVKYVIPIDKLDKKFMSFESNILLENEILLLKNSIGQNSKFGKKIKREITKLQKDKTIEKFKENKISEDKIIKFLQKYSEKLYKRNNNVEIHKQKCVNTKIRNTISSKVSNKNIENSEDYINKAIGESIVLGLKKEVRDIILKDI